MFTFFDETFGASFIRARQQVTTPLAKKEMFRSAKPPEKAMKKKMCRRNFFVYEI